MQPEERKMLEHTLKLSSENNLMLRKMKRAQTWSTIIKFLYWGMIFGGAALAWYYLQPVYVEVLNAYRGVSESVSGLQETGQGFKEQLGGVLEQIGN